MYKCMECGHLFEEGEQKTWKEDRGECWGSPCYEEMSGCPLCNGAYEEATACKICGGYGDMDEGEEYCNECKKDVLKRFQTFINAEFTAEERGLLNELYDGEEI